MIYQFSVKNFRSYKEEASLSFRALDSSCLSNNYKTVFLEDGSKIDVLTSAVILGANGSGKSNLIWGLYALSTMVKDSRSWDSITRIPFYWPFLLDDRVITNPVEMTISFTTKGRLFVYELAYAQIVLKEELYELINSEKVLVFKREDNKLHTNGAWPDIAVNLDEIKPLSTQLLLSWLGTKDAGRLLDVYAELAGIQAFPIYNGINYKAISIDVSENILRNLNTQEFKLLEKLIREADSSILGLKMAKHSPEEFQFPEGVTEIVRQNFIREYSWEIGATHKAFGKDGNVIPRAIQLDDESTGTKSIYGVGARVFHSLQTGAFLVYDEINSSIHPDLAQKLIGLYSDSLLNEQNAQLLFTTHDTSLIGDYELRADQVWFAEKDQYGNSSLFSAQDFEGVDINTPFESWYRAGRFGARPYSN